MAPKKLLITIHGINSTGAWQDVVVGTLSRNFACESIKYGGYRVFGFLRNCISFWVFPLFGAAFAVSSFWSKPMGILAGLVALGLSLWLAVWKRSRLVKKIQEEYNERIERHGDRSPHAIAHSFGTYLLCSALANYQGSVTFDRMVLFGSVVDSAYDWPKVTASNAVMAVRNQVGVRDRVASLAGWAFWISGLGNSGIKGFATSCPMVEDVHFDKFRHSDAAELRKHIREDWLPFFWGILPVEYRELLQACDNCLGARAGEHYPPPEEFADFNAKQWSWTLQNGHQTTFRHFVETSIQDFYRRARGGGALNAQSLGACYAVARDLFCSLCQKHDDHPRLIATRVAEKALSAYLLAV